MRLPRFRFTVRGMMLALAIVGIALFAIMEADRLNRLATRYRKRAEDSRFISESYSADMTWLREKHIQTQSDVEKRAIAKTLDLNGRKIDHHSRLARKYADAARYPWLPVAPDPPTPK